MAQIDIEYHKLLNKILDTGYDYLDPNRSKQGVYRKQINHYSFEYDLSEGFPALTTKKLAWKSVVGELLWILRGDTNIKYLVDNNIPIWNKDAYTFYKKRCEAENWIPFLSFNEWLEEVKRVPEEFELAIKKRNCDGNVGKNYGHQLRSFGFYNKGGDNYNLGFDQLQWLVDTLKYNPMATKKKVTYWNPTEKEETALTPCHTDFSVTCRPLDSYEREDIYAKINRLSKEERYELRPNHSDEDVHKKLDEEGISKYEISLGFTMESVDTFLGLPFNIAFYATLTHILSKMCNMKVGKLYGNLSNVHIYHSHLDQVKEQLSRDTEKYKDCNLFMNETTERVLKGNKSLNEKLRFIGINDFKLQDYESYPLIKAEMLAYDN